MLLAVAFSRFAAMATRLPVPLVQIALGAAITESNLTSAQFDPQVFFLLLLPPLLFMDGWRIPKDALVRDAPTILTLALGLVVFTVLGLGLLIHWLLPTLPLPLAFALAAVLSPTDPVAVSAIAARTPIPRRMLHILQGEALFNDASGLVCMRFAVAAALTGSFALSSALASFVWVALGGLAVGTAVTWLVTRAKPPSLVLLGDDGAAQILLTLLIPSGVYLLAEQLQCSGILAAVAAGITMGFSPHSHWQAVTRIRRTAVWETVQFAANGCIFVLLGEQIPSILAAAPQTVLGTGHQNPWWLGLYVLGLVLALAALRFVWVWASLQVTFRRSRLPGSTSATASAPTSEASTPPASHWRLVLAMSLAGVRGAVTLAGVLTLPLALGNGAPLPGRDLAIFLACGVIVLSLLLATVTLPHALRGVDLPPDASEAAGHLAERRVRSAAAHAAIAALQSAASAPEAPTDGSAQPALHADALARLLQMYQQRQERYAAAADTAAPSPAGGVDAAERHLRLLALRAERKEILRSADRLGITDVAVRKLVREVDLQEARYSS